MKLKVAGERMQHIVALHALICTRDCVVPDYVNKGLGSSHFIITGYFMVALGFVQILHGDTETLSGVYTYASLDLVTLFGTGCTSLKLSTVIEPSQSCVFNVLMMVTTLIGNLLRGTMLLTYFLLYFIVVLKLVYIMFQRTFVLRVSLLHLAAMPRPTRCVRVPVATRSILLLDSTDAHTRFTSTSSTYTRV
ncbi:hypothetical protein GN244_ATG05304 [Phytophthora infestans]|uniref:Uncharacterized protein n=1 Tax=Phytophthora infestans TaxID=4787 RepID=A0A833WMM6_PHYIN|nr:hypothetical protein GN244_ATG05304 [Phytophthora infestans]